MLTLSLNGARGNKRAESLQRIVSILLQGISLHSFNFAPAEFASFQSGIRKLRAELETAEDEDTAILLTGSAIRLLEEHNDAAEAELRSRSGECEKVIGLLADALLHVGQSSPEAMMAMKELQREIASASSGAGIASARERLTGLMNRVRTDAADLMAGRKASGPAGETDSITGLADSGFAAAAMSAVWDRRENYYAAMFAVDRLESINVRFGFKAGDQVLLVLSQHVAQHIGPKDQLFRWRGPCLLALIERHMPESMIASEVARTIGHRMEHAITIGDREVMVPITASWNLFPLAAAASVEEIVIHLNTYALNRGTKFATAPAR